MLLDSFKGLGQTFVEILRTRLEILSLDASEARLRFVSLLMLGALTFLLLTLGILFGIILLLVMYWESDRLMVLGTLTAAFMTCGWALFVYLSWKLRSGPRLFEGTIVELEKDGEALGRNGKRGD